MLVVALLEAVAWVVRGQKLVLLDFALVEVVLGDRHRNRLAQTSAVMKLRPHIHRRYSPKRSSSSSGGGLRGGGGGEAGVRAHAQFLQVRVRVLHATRARAARPTGASATAVRGEEPEEVVVVARLVFVVGCVWRRRAADLCAPGPCARTPGSAFAPAEEAFVEPCLSKYG